MPAILPKENLKTSLTRARLRVLLAYLVALGVAIATGYAMGDQHPLLVALAADIAGTLVIFLFSYAHNNSSFYDPYWSVVPFLLGVFYIVPGEGVVIRQILVMALIFVWGLRLTYNWLRGWRGLDHEDWRYVDLRAKSGKAYWLVSFAGIMLFPTLLVFAGCIPVYYALTEESQGLGMLDMLAVLFTSIAIWVEAMSDRELHRFVTENEDPGAFLKTGLWAWSRHPNYFGEISFWVGMFLFGLAASPAHGWYMLAGPVAMIVLFFFISLPLIDKRMLARRPGYAQHMKKVNSILPWFPKK